jgi:fido (protein-threonine AMPylation protein)
LVIFINATLARSNRIFLRQFNCAAVGKQINFDSVKMHAMYEEGNKLMYQNPVNLQQVK